MALLPFPADPAGLSWTSSISRCELFCASPKLVYLCLYWNSGLWFPGSSVMKKLLVIHSIALRLNGCWNKMTPSVRPWPVPFPRLEFQILDSSWHQAAVRWRVFLLPSQPPRSAPATPLLQGNHFSFFHFGPHQCLAGAGSHALLELWSNTSWQVGFGVSLGPWPVSWIYPLNSNYRRLSRSTGNSSPFF